MMPHMTKRFAVALLWFLAGWYVGGYVAVFLGISDLIGPILGMSAAVLFAGDPLGIVWPHGQVVLPAASEPEERVNEFAEAA